LERGYGHINEVRPTLRRVGLVLRWVTVLLFKQATQANSAWSPLRGWRNEYSDGYGYR